MAEREPVLGPAGLTALGIALRAQPMLAFDFDGTLAPIVARPGDAGVPPALVGHLRALAQRLPLAIVTGRSVADVAPRLGFAAAYIIGNHGAEEAGAAASYDTAPLDAVRERIRGQQQVLAAAGIAVEDKRYSLALHFRQAPDLALAMLSLDSLLADLPAGARMVPGRMVRNIVLADAPDKGDAVASLVRRTGRSLAIFVGDDVNDETVFSSAPPDWLTVRVGNDFAQTRARYFLAAYSDVERLLATMLLMLS